MAADAAALLDQLMGSHRDAVPGDNIKETQWWDPEVCKHYLCGFCPCELFTNTRSDVGTCHKIHDEKLRKAYEESERKGKMGLEDEFLDTLEKLVRDLDRKITRGKERLRKSADAKEEGGPTSEKLKCLSVDINNTVTELEQLGAMGRVEDAQNLMRKVEELERERERERLAISNTTPRTLAGFEVDANDFHEKMELCDVCGSFLVIGDTQSRVDAHLLGKQHMGYSRIRGAITELKKLREERWKIREEERKNRREEVKGRSRSRERERVRKQSRHSRSRSHSKERYRRRSLRSRSKSRERNRHGSRRSRSRSRERNRRSRSRERNRRSRSRERSRRSRSRERKRRSRSRGRERRGSRRSRSQSKERNRRSRSRDRDRRSRSRERKRRSRSRERKIRSQSREKDRRSRSRERDRRSRSRERKRSRDRSPAKENGDRDSGKDKEKKSLKDVEDGEVD